MIEQDGASAKRPLDLGSRKIIDALRSERDHVAKGLGYVVASARRSGIHIVILIVPKPGRASQAIDENLEGARAVWGEDISQGRAEVFFVDADEGVLTLRFCQGEPPEAGTSIHLFQRDFITPILDLWSADEIRLKAMAALSRPNRSASSAETAPLPAEYDVLRSGQSKAVQAHAEPAHLLIGPPGTGKTYTVGALIARMITRHSAARVILLGPTNTAVDGALLSVAGWCQRLGRSELLPSMKRLGTRFDINRYSDHQDLLAPGVYEAGVKLALLEADEPSKKDVEAYAAWKSAVEAARKDLRAEVESISHHARVVGLTTASAVQWYSILRAQQWHFLVCDEASQIPLPTALAVATLSGRGYFSGDPNQLAPVVQSREPSVQRALARTIFEGWSNAPSTLLDEQSRMAVGICQTVSSTFYESRLKVCERARCDAIWKHERSSHFINGREVPRVLIERIEADSTWSKKYGGMIRLESAMVVRDVVDEFCGSYTDVDEILVLTPFRAQRALLKRLLMGGEARRVKVSTVHRSQGAEASIVVFDPVDAAGSFLNSDNGRRLINVAASRAKTHLVMTLSSKDLENRWVNSIDAMSKLLNRPGKFLHPFKISRSPFHRTL
ncbi:DEAD/DEAH box helicase [Maricaulaceae bacterium MS644]